MARKRGSAGEEPSLFGDSAQVRYLPYDTPRAVRALRSAARRSKSTQL